MMQLSPIPAPPTDDLWKFCAITGVWVFFGLSALVLFTAYVSFASHDRMKAVVQQGRTSSFVRCLDTRISELRSNKQQPVDPCVKRDQLQNMDIKTLDSFKKFASAQLPKVAEEIKKNKSNTYFTWLSRAYVYVWIPFALIASLIMVYLGFRGWVKGQKLSAKSRDLDLRIKAQQLRLLEFEEAHQLLSIRSSGRP